MNPLTENPDTFIDDPVAELRRDALAMVEECIECGSCYIDCAFNSYENDRERCKFWIRKSNDSPVTTNTLPAGIFRGN